MLELESSLVLLSPYAVLKLRFPIPDLRPLDQKRPISERAVRKEILSLEMSNLELKSHQGSDLQQQVPSTSTAKLTKLLEASFSDMHGRGNLLTYPFYLDIVPFPFVFNEKAKCLEFDPL